MDSPSSNPDELYQAGSYTVSKFFIELGADVAKVITLSQDHGLILKRKVWDRCGYECRLGISTKT